VFVWRDRRRLAAQLVAEDQITDAEIAAKVGVAPRALCFWRIRPEFSADVEGRMTEFDWVIDADEAKWSARDLAHRDDSAGPLKRTRTPLRDSHDGSDL
jgi:hypothetical protein